MNPWENPAAVDPETGLPLVTPPVAAPEPTGIPAEYGLGGTAFGVSPGDEALAALAQPGAAPAAPEPAPDYVFDPVNVGAADGAIQAAQTGGPAVTGVDAQAAALGADPNAPAPEPTPAKPATGKEAAQVATEQDYSQQPFNPSEGMPQTTDEVQPYADARSAYQKAVDSGASPEEAAAIAQGVQAKSRENQVADKSLDAQASADAEVAEIEERHANEQMMLDKAHAVEAEDRKMRYAQAEATLQDRINRTRESPANHWNNLSGFGKAMTALSLMAGAFVEGNSRGEIKNPAIPFLLKAIEQDMAATRSNRQADIQLLQELRIGNEHAGNAAFQDYQRRSAQLLGRLATAKQHIDRQLANAKTEIQRRNLKATKGSVEGMMTDVVSDMHASAQAQADKDRKVRLEESVIAKNAMMAEKYRAAAAATAPRNNGYSSGGAQPPMTTGASTGVLSEEFASLSPHHRWIAENPRLAATFLAKAKLKRIEDLSPDDVKAHGYFVTEWKDDKGRQVAIKRPIAYGGTIDQGEAQKLDAKLTFMRRAPAMMRQLQIILQNADGVAVDARGAKTDAGKARDALASELNTALTQLVRSEGMQQATANEFNSLLTALTSSQDPKKANFNIEALVRSSTERLRGYYDDYATEMGLSNVPAVTKALPKFSENTSVSNTGGELAEVALGNLEALKDDNSEPAQALKTTAQADIRTALSGAAPLMTYRDGPNQGQIVKLPVKKGTAIPSTNERQKIDTWVDANVAEYYRRLKALTYLPEGERPYSPEMLKKRMLEGVITSNGYGTSVMELEGFMQTALGYAFVSMRDKMTAASKPSTKVAPVPEPFSEASSTDYTSTSDISPDQIPEEYR